MSAREGGKALNRNISSDEINRLMNSLEIEVISLSECLVSSGHQLNLGPNEAPGLHYILTGSGKMTIKGRPKIELLPHTLVVMPPGQPFSIEMSAPTPRSAPLHTVEARDRHSKVDGINRFTAGETDPRMIMVCGYFRATYGSSIDIFRQLTAPIVEYFSGADRIDQRLRAALDELVAQEVGAGAMTSTLLKQVILMLLRKSLESMDLWVQRFSMLSDPQIGRAFAKLVANPGAAHTVSSLAECAALSRSAFMARFTSVIGQSPMLILRDLRMRQAAMELTAGNHPVERVSRNAGYASKSSFIKAFKQAYGVDPSQYRSEHNLAHSADGIAST